MTFWEAEDRQGVKLFSQRPSYSSVHEIWVGVKPKRKPRKGDRVIRRFIQIIHCPKEGA